MAFVMYKKFDCDELLSVISEVSREDESTAPDALNDRGQTNDLRFNNSSRTQSESSFINGHGGPLQTQDRNRGFSMENGPEGVKVGLKIQSQILDERMDSFQSLLEAGAALTHDEQEKVFDQIRSDHEKLRKDYLQYKEDYNALRRSNAAGDVNFDENKELEGELFRLGMKFDDIHEKVDEKRKQKHSERRPFQSNRLQSDSDAMTSGMSDQEGRAVDQMKKKIKGTKAGNDLLNPKENMELQKNLTRLHDEYNALMDRYRRLKQMAQTPERDKEIDNLVRKLHEICDEEPEVFRMPQELNDRTDDTSMSPSYTSNDTSLWDEDETDSERWEQLQRGEEEGRSFSRRQSEASQGRRPSKDDFSRSLEYARTENKPFTKDSEMQNGMGGSSSSLHRSDLDLNGGAQGRLHESSMSGSRDSLSSRTRSPFDSTFDRDSPTPRLPRPRRHDHPERRSNNLKKRPESGSFSSLQDSGISEHEGANGKERGATGGPLSNLPGPGTFKQMTKQRHAGDADSGFIGSMVGSEVSQMSNRQQQPSLRLRHQHSDSGSDRPRSRSSRADDTASIASSRSSRRGQKQERPSSRESSRPKTKQSRAGQTRDYTDDSYTLTTESEMSFDIPEQRSRRGADARRRQGSLERIIQEEEEERPRSITSQSSRRSQKSDRNQQTPVKLQKRKVNVSFSSKSDLSDEDVTPKPTPNQSFNESRELFSSEEDTPREIVNAPLEILQQPQATVSVSKSENVIRPPTPSAKKEPPRPPTPGIRTPRSERSERSATPVKQRDVPRLEIEKSLEERPRSRNERPRSREEFRQKVLEDRAVGSDSDDTIQESVATAATQGSQSSDKFKMLQDEIGRLREAFHNATKQPQPIPQPMPPMQPPQQPQNQDQYFDPTEDPYAFMRGPRRRANSFSGAAGRDWDEWWRHPLTQQQDDIPLGYAAADSYNQNRRANPDAVAETRSRRRMRRRYRKPVNEDGTTQNNYDSDQAPSQVTASNVTDERLFNYYVPQYSAARTQTSQVPQGYYPPQVSAPRLQHYSSQPNLLQNTSFQAVPQPRPQPQPQQQNVPTNSYATPISAGYSRLRPAMQSPQRNRQVYSYDDLDMQGHQPVGYIITQPSQGEGQSQRPPPPMYVERTAACPLCGGAGYHTHGDSIYEVPPAEQPPVAYLVDRTPRVRVRPRSKSASRVRHYSPVGRIRSRYLIRDISTESSSTESDDDIIYRQRSRTSRRRTRSHRMRKYRKSREFEDALNESLNLTEEIDALTHKCIGKVSSELAKSKKKKDFGSSYW